MLKTFGTRVLTSDNCLLSYIAIPILHSVAAQGSVPSGSSIRVGAPSPPPQCHYPAHLSMMLVTRASNTGPISQYRYFGIEKNQYRYTGINTGIQRLPILTAVAATTCKHCIDNDHLMSA